MKIYLGLIPTSMKKRFFNKKSNLEAIFKLLTISIANFWHYALIAQKFPGSNLKSPGLSRVRR